MGSQALQAFQGTLAGSEAEAASAVQRRVARCTAGGRCSYQVASSAMIWSWAATAAEASMAVGMARAASEVSAAAADRAAPPALVPRVLMEAAVGPVPPAAPPVMVGQLKEELSIPQIHCKKLTTSSMLIPPAVVPAGPPSAAGMLVPERREDPAGLLVTSLRAGMAVTAVPRETVAMVAAAAMAAMLLVAVASQCSLRFSTLATPMRRTK